jgi:hypothetical protein
MRRSGPDLRTWRPCRQLPPIWEAHERPWQRALSWLRSQVRQSSRALLSPDCGFWVPLAAFWLGMAGALTTRAKRPLSALRCKNPSTGATSQKRFPVTGTRGHAGSLLLLVSCGVKLFRHWHLCVPKNLNPNVVMMKSCQTGTDLTPLSRDIIEGCRLRESLYGRHAGLLICV